MPAPGRQRPGYASEFLDSQIYIVGPCLERKRKKERKTVKIISHDPIVSFLVSIMRKLEN